MKRFFGPLNILLAGVLFLAASGCADNPGANAQSDKQDSEAKVEVKVVKYKELGETIKSLKGKVVVVDFWSTT